jgi:omega-6 fatty acid desaturase (delta-12 desaturase)
MSLPAIDQSWKKIVAQYQQPDVRRSIWQIVNSLVPFIALWGLMAYTLRISYWLTLLLAIPAAGFMIRLFIIFHDCGHGSFFKSQAANDAVGILTGILTFTPYYQWRHHHAIHHATAGDLDRRGVGDVKTITVQEYLALPWWKKAGYRIMRNPLIMLTIGALLVFLVAHRFPGRAGGTREHWSAIWTDLALAGIVAALSALIGFWNFWLVQLPILAVASSLGVWLFYVQHNFEGSWWVRHEQWDYARAGLQGSSFYKLPRLLQWFTGNIGFHHIHHLSPKIPNYRLEECHRDNPLFQVSPLTIRTSLKSLTLRFWDEQEQRMVGIEALKRYRHPAPAA